MARLERKKLADFDPEQRELFDHVVANRPLEPDDGHIGGPFDVWLRSPDMGTRFVGLGEFFRFRTSVDRRYVELVIIVVGQRWKAQFEWFAHEGMARAAGVPENVIQSIKRGERPEMTDPSDIAAYDLASELQDTHQLSQEAFDRAKAQFGEKGVAELVGLCGFYDLVSMTLNAFDVDLPKGVELPFPD